MPVPIPSGDRERQQEDARRAGSQELGHTPGAVHPNSDPNTDDRPSKEEAERLFEERMEEEYAKREGGA